MTFYQDPRVPPHFPPPTEPQPLFALDPLINPHFNKPVLNIAWGRLVQGRFIDNSGSMRTDRWPFQEPFQCAYSVVSERTHNPKYANCDFKPRLY